jgi:hypothetical protein
MRKFILVKDLRKENEKDFVLPISWHKFKRLSLSTIFQGIENQ